MRLTFEENKNEIENLAAELSFPSKPDDILSNDMTEICIPVPRMAQIRKTPSFIYLFRCVKGGQVKKKTNLGKGLSLACEPFSTSSERNAHLHVGFLRECALHVFMFTFIWTAF